MIRSGLDKYLEGWRPYKGQDDIYDNEIEDREYNTIDYDRKLIIVERTQTVANRILKANGCFSKTIIFCVDIEHAEHMRQAYDGGRESQIHHAHRVITRRQRR